MSKSKTIDIDKLNDVFNVAERELNTTDIFDVVPINNSSETPQNASEDNQNAISNMSDKDDEIISIKTLKEDYFFIKESIKTNVKIGKEILDKIDIENSANDSEMIESISSLIKNINASLKDLSRIYKDIKEIEKLKNNSNQNINENANNANNTNIQNNILIHGTLDDILSKF